MDNFAFFAGEWLLDAAVEEVGDVGVLFGLGYAEVAEVGCGHDVGEEVVHALGWDDHGEGELGVVLRHHHVVEIGGDGVEGDLVVEFGGLGEVDASVGGEAGAAREDSGDLADSIGPVVETDDGVAFGDEADGLVVGVHADEGLNEFVGDAVVVALEDAGVGVVVLPCFGVAGDHGAEGFVLLLPAVVAVHGEVAAGDAG